MCIVKVSVVTAAVPVSVLNCRWSVGVQAETADTFLNVETWPNCVKEIENFTTSSIANRDDDKFCMYVS